MQECAFCNIVSEKLNATIIYEDELIIGFMDIEPINPGHVLLIPKKHKLDLDELDDNEVQRIMSVSQIIVKAIKDMYKPDGYSIMQNGGKFNDIGHYHMHIFPRYQEDGFGWTFGDTKESDLTMIGDQLAKKIKETTQLIK